MFVPALKIWFNLILRKTWLNAVKPTIQIDTTWATAIDFDEELIILACNTTQSLYMIYITYMFIDGPKKRR